MKTFIVWLALAHAGAFSAALAEELKLTAAERIPILAWHGIPEKETSIERFKELAAAGFTHTWWNGYSNAEAMQKALDAGKETGIKIVGGCPELEKSPEDVAKKIGKHPALAGYCLRDEPSANDFAALSKWAQRLQGIDPAPWTYVNLLPTYATPQQLACKNYQEYIDRYLAEFPVLILTFDHYPGMQKTYDANWYENL